MRAGGPSYEKLFENGPHYVHLIQETATRVWGFICLVTILPGDITGGILRMVIILHSCTGG